MTRYFTSKRPRASWVEDEVFCPDPGPLPSLSVSDHEATNTGLLDADGDIIWRAPNPIGFVWDD